jgi:hypothetical protein
MWLIFNEIQKIQGKKIDGEGDVYNEIVFTTINMYGS